MSNTCSIISCEAFGEEMTDCNNGTLQCGTCKSRSCSHNEPDTFWYKCGKCRDFGVYTGTAPKVCEYCGSSEVVC